MNRSKSLILAIAALLLSPPSTQAQQKKKPKPTAAPPGTTVLRDLPYTHFQKDEIQLLLDLYRPEKFEGELPVVLWVHGGGWKNGSKDRCKAAWLATKGFAVASINYRLIGSGVWPDQINDCRKAVRWLKKNAHMYGLSKTEYGAWGGSAGGHLVALMGTLPYEKNEAISSRVKAICDWYGPSDLLTMPPNMVANGRTEEDVAKSNGARLLGVTVKDDVPRAKSASAFWQVSSDDSAFLIMHGDKDPGVPIAQSEKLHKKLQAHGVRSKFHVVKGAGHGGKEFQTEEAQSLILDFFNRELK